MPIKDIQKWAVLKPNLDVCGWRGWGGESHKLRLSCGHRKLITPYQVIFCY